MKHDAATAVYLALLEAAPEEATSDVLIGLAQRLRNEAAAVTGDPRTDARTEAAARERLVRIEGVLAGRGVTFRDEMWIRVVDGRLVALLPLLHGGRIGRGPNEDRGSFDELWDYRSYLEAVMRYIEWDGRGEPGGWVRHMPSARRRPDGDATREYVRP